MKSNFINGTVTSDKDEEIVIDSSSHYEHLILNYSLKDAGSVENSLKDVYSGNDTEKLTVGADFERNGSVV